MCGSGAAHREPQQEMLELLTLLSPVAVGAVWVVELSSSVVCLSGRSCLQPCYGCLPLLGAHGWRAGLCPAEAAACLCCAMPEESRPHPREASVQERTGEMGQISWFGAARRD